MLDPSTNNFPHNHAKLSDNGKIAGSYDSYAGINYGSLRARKPTENYANYMSWKSNTSNDFLAFKSERKLVEDEDSGVSSPPLWRTSPPRSPQHRPNHYRSLSPSSRAQAIARGQKELMEMVSQMPEGSYELSLKDFVEHPMNLQARQESFSDERSIDSTEPMHRRPEREKEVKIIKKNGSKKAQMNRSGSIDNGGLLLKMVFPIPCSSRRKKKSVKKSNSSVVSNSNSQDGRVSPKPLLLNDGSVKNVEEEWWKKKFSDSAGSTESAGLSSNSGGSKSSGSSSSRSSSRNSSRHGNGGCWSWVFSKKGKRQNK